MKKIFAFAAAAVLLFVSSMRSDARVEDHVYGFITSCGTEQIVVSEDEMDIEEAMGWLEWYEFWDCGIVL